MSEKGVWLLCTENGGKQNIGVLPTRFKINYTRVRETRQWEKHSVDDVLARDPHPIF